MRPLGGSWKHSSRMLSTGFISKGRIFHHTSPMQLQPSYTAKNKIITSVTSIQFTRNNSTAVKSSVVIDAPEKTDSSTLELVKSGNSETVWASLEDVAANLPTKGAILSFSQMNFFQILVFPYTYTVMYYLDLMHQFLPWWLAIIATTATARLAFFPLVLKQNIIGIKSANIMPETQKLQVKMNQAMVAGDAYNQALNRTKLQLLYKEHGLTMKDRLIPILFQAPMYASVFLLLRTLTGVPVEGLSTGGALWFTDLTVPDPYYILPLLTSSSMFMLFEFGLEGAVNPSQGMAPMGRYLLRAMPFGLFFFIQGFPAATLLFWSTSNLFTLAYAMIFKNQWVKKKLNIPQRIQHNPDDLPLANMTFKGQVKTAIDKGKVKRTSLDVRRLDDIAFKKAGVGPLRKTYKEPPKDT